MIAAPVVFGRLHIVPVAAGFLERHPAVDIQLRLGDRNVNLIEEHVDVALRIGALPDSSIVATRVGAVRRVACASPSYLQRFGLPPALEELAAQRLRERLRSIGVPAADDLPRPGAPARDRRHASPDRRAAGSRLAMRARPP